VITLLAASAPRCRPLSRDPDTLSPARPAGHATLSRSPPASALTAARLPSVT
jgi:hypothetical protein